MNKEKVLYICGRKHFGSNIFDWYETFKSALLGERIQTEIRIK